MIEKRKAPSSVVTPNPTEGEDLELKRREMYWGKDSKRKLRWYQTLKESSEELRGSPLNMSEARYLKQLIIKFFDERPEDSDSVFPDIFETFLVNTSHVPSSEMDPLTVDASGNEVKNPHQITNEQLTALWQKYERDGEVPYASWTDIELAKKEYEEEKKSRDKKDE